ncbi:MAG: M23 family metallopeptidase, partial [Hyphomicrobiales bacterium]
AFDHSILAFQENLTHLNKLKKKVDLIPIRRPLKTGKITSQFGRRLDPFMKRYALHSGMDFKAPIGTPVYATGPGKVVKASWNGGYGRLVEIQHAGNITTRYAHLSRIDVKVGDSVTSGKVIGRVGSTGRSTGPHLHYETRLGKKAVNPGRFIKAGIRVRSLL